MKKDFRKQILLCLSVTLFLAWSVQAQDVNSDGTVLVDWFDRIGPELGAVDYYADDPNAPIVWSGGIEDKIYLGGGKLNLWSGTWGDESKAKLMGEGFSPAFTPAVPVEVIQVDFKVDSLHEEMPYQYGPAINAWAYDPGTFYPMVKLAHEADDPNGTFSLHVVNATEYTVIYKDQDGLAFGNWYRLTERWDDTVAQEVKFYLEDLDGAGPQQLIHTHAKVNHQGASTVGIVPNCVSLGLGRSVCSIEFDRLLVGEEGDRPEEPAMTQCGLWGYQASDLNHDCYVDIQDFADLAGQWLSCTDPLDPCRCVNLDPPPVGPFYADGSYFTDTFERGPVDRLGDADTGQSWSDWDSKMTITEDNVVLGNGGSDTSKHYASQDPIMGGNLGHRESAVVTTIDHKVIQFDFCVNQLAQDTISSGVYGCVTEILTRNPDTPTADIIWLEDEATADDDYVLQVAEKEGDSAYFEESGLVKGHWYRIVIWYSLEENQYFLEDPSLGTEQAYIGSSPVPTTPYLWPNGCKLQVRGSSSGMVKWDNFKAGVLTNTP